jgi:hypothetical protein
MSDRNPTLEEIIELALHHKAFDTRHSLPGQIKSYDVGTQLAEVEVCINPTRRCDGGDELVVLGVIKNVPIEWPSGGGYFMSFPLNKGDPVKLTFHDFSLDQWIEKGGVVDVDDQRTHHLSDASAFPGMHARPSKLSSASASKLIIGKDGDPSMQITIDGNFIKLSDNATKLVALAEKAAQWAAALDAVIGGTVINEPGNGSPSAFQAALAAALLLIPTPSEANWGATKVKAE